jgi:hypothetical protein
MHHGLAAAVTAALLWCWGTTYGSARAGRWLAVGLLVGLTGLMRWQLLALALLPAGEFVLVCRRGAGVPARAEP